MKLLALIFDFDGTIAETERHGHRVAYNEAFETFDLPWRWDEARYGELLAIAGGKERMSAFIRSDYPAYASDELPSLVARLHAEKARRFKEIAPSIALRPGVKRLLLDARAAGVRCAIATTAEPSGVEAVLASDPGVRACFEVIAAGDVVERKKPAPDIYRYALNELGISAAEAIAFEDSNVGLRSAVAAGLAVVITKSSYTANEDFSGASLVLDHLDDNVSIERLRALLAIGPVK